MEWILVVLIYAGPMAHGDSVALQSLPGWTTEASCISAGNAMKPLVKASTKEMRFVCVKK